MTYRHLFSLTQHAFEWRNRRRNAWMASAALLERGRRAPTRNATTVSRAGVGLHAGHLMMTHESSHDDDDTTTKAMTRMGVCTPVRPLHNTAHIPQSGTDSSGRAYASTYGFLAVFFFSTQLNCFCPPRAGTRDGCSHLARSGQGSVTVTRSPQPSQTSQRQ
jgi:hypothetical protein